MNTYVNTYMYIEVYIYIYMYITYIYIILQRITNTASLELAGIGQSCI
jgi:hypothetical protein